MLDNLKSAVLSHPYGQPAVYHPRYLEFAAHYGFDLRACQPRRANEKGRVENAVGYVKKNFLAGLALTSLSAVQTAAQQWMQEANERQHATTRRRPVDLFAEEKLRPLPVSGIYDTGLDRDTVANALCRVHFDGNRYSVSSRHAGSRVRVRAYADRILIYRQDQLVATHLRSYNRGCDIADPEHTNELVCQRRQARDAHVLHRFLALCGEAEKFHRQLAERRPNPLLHVRRIVALSEVYGVELTARALRDAMEFAAFSSECVANLLEQRKRISPPAGALHLTRQSDLLDLDIPPADLSIYEEGTRL